MFFVSCVSHVFEISDKASFKPVSPATDTSKKNEISLVGSFQKANNKGADQTALMLCCSQTPEDWFSRAEAL